MKIDIIDIKEGLPGISSIAAMQLYETFEVCMHHSGHSEEVLLSMEGITAEPITILWKDEYNEQKERTGFDYWLGDKDSYLFQKKARLEVSGILRGDDTTLKNRHAEKVTQTDKSDALQLPAYISVIEFSKPKAIFTKK